MDGICGPSSPAPGQAFEQLLSKQRIKRLARQVIMEFGYYPGCSLTGSAKRLDRGVRQICRKLGHTLKTIPDWNCCGAVEYGNRNELLSMSNQNLIKAQSISNQVIVPCPACYKNLKDADTSRSFNIVSPLELLNSEDLLKIEQKENL
ncbi:MAG TPA: heterodisulfide reductase-related iron-sulfur binding cluster [Oculatellaceae cyanobacterium]